MLAFLNIVGSGMRGGKSEQNLEDMESAPTGEMAKKHPGLIVGIKTAHYAGPEWAPVERAVEAGTIASVPVMVDFGANKPERPLAELVTKKLRPGDIYTHVYSGLRGEQDASGHVNPGMLGGASAASSSMSATAAAASCGTSPCRPSRKISCRIPSRPTSTSAA